MQASKMFALMAAGGAIVAVLTGCGGGSGDSSADSDYKKEVAGHPEYAQYTPLADTSGMITAYTKLKNDNASAAAIRPKILATVVGITPLDDDQGPGMASTFGFPYVAGEQVAALYTQYGWTMMPVTSSSTITEGSVVDVDMPSANDFSDLSDSAGVTTTLNQLMTSGSVGIGSVHGNCIGSDPATASYKLTCDGAPASYIVNESQFPAGSLDWLKKSGSAN